MPKKLQIRLILGLFALAGLFTLYRWWREFTVDPDLGVANTIGWIAAVEYLDEGSRTIILKPDGTKTPVPDHPAGATDREPVWRPDGNRLFFVSDREENTFLVYRWNLANNRVERRAIGTRSMSDLSFGPPGYVARDGTGIITQGGFVLSYDPREGATRQLLPPVVDDRGTTEEGGTQDQFDAVYKRLGTSFRTALWGTNRESIIVVMRREQGEVLVVQGLVPVTNPQTGSTSVPGPLPLIAGDRIDVEVSSKGQVVFSVRGFRWLDPQQIPKEFVKNGVATTPYRHVVGFLDSSQPTGQVQPILASNDDKIVPGAPRVSPDGDEVLISMGELNDRGQFKGRDLVRFPVAANGATQGRGILQGDILDYQWQPNGQGILFVRRDGSNRMIFSANADGSNVKNRSGEGEFGVPVMSPQREGGQ